MTQTGIESAFSFVENIRTSLQDYKGNIEASSVIAMLDDIAKELKHGEKIVEDTITKEVQKNQASLVYDPVQRKFIKNK